MTTTTTTTPTTNTYRTPRGRRRCPVCYEGRRPVYWAELEKQVNASVVSFWKRRGLPVPKSFV